MSRSPAMSGKAMATKSLKEKWLSMVQSAREKGENEVGGSSIVTVFILEQVPAGSVLEASKYQVLEAPFQRWFRNFPVPFRDGTGTLSVTASDSSCALLRLGSIRSIGKSSYFTFLTSNL